MSRMLKTRTSLFGGVGYSGSRRGPGVPFGELFLERFGGFFYGFSLVVQWFLENEAS